MRIDSLLLKGYKPLLVNGHSEFEIHFQSIYQLLIGTNGSGKSSVMRELSPMPAYSGDFIKGGSKIIKLPHRGKYYILTSDFTTGNKHSFLVDGVEENPGGTYTVQKELVHSHFGLSEELHSILTDSLRFTRMTPQKRREWIIRLSGGDLGYAMHVFQQLKSRARDQVGVVKHLNARLNQETDKLASDDKLEENVALCHTLKNELTWMMESKDVTIKDNERIITGRMINALTDITNLSNEVIKANIKRPHFIAKVDIEDISDVDRILADLKAEQTANDGLYKHYAEEHHKLSDIIHALVQSNADSVDGLQTKIAELKAQRDVELTKIQEWRLTDADPSQLIAITDAISPDLVEVFSNIRDNRDNYFSNTAGQEAKQRYDNIRIERDKLQNAAAKLEHRVEHIEQSKKENCPKCGYLWSPGVKEGELTNVQEQLAEARRRIAKAIEIETQTKEYLDEFTAYIDWLRRGKRLIESNAALKPLWRVIMDNQYLISTPKAALPVIARWRKDLNVCLHIYKLETELFTYEEAYRQASTMQTGTHFSDRLKDLDTAIEQNVTHKQTLQKKIQALGVYRQTVYTVIEKSERIKRLIQQVMSDLVMVSTAIRNDLLEKTIRDHQSMLAHTEQTLITAKALTDIIEDLTKSCEQAKQDSQLYQILADELSPTDGLIADMLKEFNGLMVDQMNAIIGTIWTYEMKVLPCGMDGEEMDYKFPVSIKSNTDIVVPDVSKTSSSQVSIIDFSFKLIVMLYLGLEDFPLYLDELASDMDDQHRNNTMIFLKSLVESQRCSQLFLISHYFSLYGIFTAAEICVMDDSNLNQIPTGVNQHVKMR